MLQESPCARSPGLFNRTAGRRLCATNVTGLLHSSFVVIITYITINLFSGLLQNICLKKSESLAQSYLKQKIATLVTEGLSCSFLFRPVFSV